MIWSCGNSYVYVRKLILSLFFDFYICTHTNVQLSAVTSDNTICTSEKLNRLCVGVALSIRSKQLGAALRTYKKTQVLDPLTWIDLRMRGSVSPSVLQRIKSIVDVSLEM